MAKSAPNKHRKMATNDYNTATFKYTTIHKIHETEMKSDKKHVYSVI